MLEVTCEESDTFALLVSVLRNVDDMISRFLEYFASDLVFEYQMTEIVQRFLADDDIFEAQIKGKFEALVQSKSHQ